MLEFKDNKLSVLPEGEREKGQELLEKLDEYLSGKDEYEKSPSHRIALEAFLISYLIREGEKFNFDKFISCVDDSEFKRLFFKEDTQDHFEIMGVVLKFGLKE
jgi:hypothetical protein